MIRIRFYYMTQTHRIEILIGFLLEMQCDFGAAFGISRRLNGELAHAVRLPNPTAFIARLARCDDNFVRNHESGIETDAKLADKIYVARFFVFALFRPGHRFDECCGP